MWVARARFLRWRNEFDNAVFFGQNRLLGFVLKRHMTLQSIKIMTETLRITYPGERIC